MKNIRKIVFTAVLLLFLGTGVTTKASQDVVENKLNGLKPLIVEVVPPSQESQIFQEEMDSVGVSDAENAEYGKYATDYYYNQLPAAKQALWDKLDAMCMVYLTSTINASANKTNYVTYSGLSKEEAAKTVQLFRYSNPQYYFLDLTSYYSYNLADTDGMVSLSVLSSFSDGNARASATTGMFQSVANALQIMQAGTTDLQKEKLAHDWIVSKVTYDSGNANNFNQVAYSVFSTGTTVCAGYSQAMQLLSNAVGIDCAVVTSSTHEWNIIRLNDTWYYLDLTWDDVDGTLGYVTYYNFFNRSYSRILSLDVGNAHQPEGFYSGMLPSSTKDSGATSLTIGTIYTPSDTWSPPVFRFSGGMATITGSAGTKIYYTMTGSQPAVASAKSKVYTGSFSCPVGTVVSAITVGDGKWDSGPASTTAVAESTPNTSPTPPITQTQPVTAALYTVSYQGMGGSATGSQTVTEGNAAQRPADPVRAGYTFAGWFTDVNRVNAYQFGSAVASDLVLYAKWTGNTCQLTLNANGGYIGKKNITQKVTSVINGDTYRSLLQPKRPSYTFTGWFTKKAGGTKVTSSSIADLTGSQTLYARWAKSGKISKGKISSIQADTAGTLLLYLNYDKAASGYQIRISTRKSMNSSKQFTLTENSCIIGGMKSGRTYYLQSRAWQKDSVTGKKYYGNWSSVKSKKVN